MLAETQIHIMAAGKIPSLREVKDLASHLYVREYVAIQKTKFPSNSDQLRAYQYGPGGTGWGQQAPRDGGECRPVPDSTAEESSRGGVEVCSIQHLEFLQRHAQHETTSRLREQD